MSCHYLLTFSISMENIRAATEIKYHVVLSSNVICMRIDLSFRSYFSQKEREKKLLKGSKSTCLFGRPVCVDVKIYLLALFQSFATHRQTYIYILIWWTQCRRWCQMNLPTLRPHFLLCTSTKFIFILLDWKQSFILVVDVQIVSVFISSYLDIFSSLLTGFLS